MTQDQGDFEEEDAADRKSGKALGVKRKFDEFECPLCSAFNPHDNFGNGDDINCNWCGVAFVAQVDDEGKLKLREA